MAKRVLVSKQGLVTCPSCMSHMEGVSETGDVACPFCGEALDVSQQAHAGRFGGGVMGALRMSRSAALAATLGASLTMAACGNSGGSEPVALYGGPPITEDMADEDATDEDAGADLGEQPAPAYGAPPSE